MCRRIRFAILLAHYITVLLQHYSTYSIYLGPFLTKKNEKKKWFAWVLCVLMNQLKSCLTTTFQPGQQVVVRHLGRRISRQAVVRHLVESAHEQFVFLQEYPWFALNCCNSAATLCWQNVPYANLNEIKLSQSVPVRNNV